MSKKESVIQSKLIDKILEIEKTNLVVGDRQASIVAQILKAVDDEMNEEMESENGDK